MDETNIPDMVRRLNAIAFDLSMFGSEQMHGAMMGRGVPLQTAKLITDARVNVSRAAEKLTKFHALRERGK